MKKEHHDIIHQHEDGHWWYAVRRTMVHDIISEIFPGKTDLNIADIGSGAGALAKEMERYGSCMAVDPSPLSIKYCRDRGIKMVTQGNADATGLESEQYDLVTCLDVLEHLKDEHPAIHEIHRILKPGGYAIIFVPAFMFLWGVTDVSSQHFRRYTLPELVKLFPESQFSIRKNSYFNTFLFPPIACVRILARLFGQKEHSEVSMGNASINKIFYALFRLERKLFKDTKLPFGVSVMLVVQKK